MPYPTIIQLIAEEFAKAGIRTIMVGGFAVNYHGVSRQTADLDLMMCDSDVAAAGKIMTQAGYRALHQQETFARWHSENVMLMDVDFLFIDLQTFEKVWAAGFNAQVGGRTLRVPSLDHLIAMKLHAMKHDTASRGQKDLLDIVALAQENKLDLRTEHYRSLCQRFGTDEVYGKILSLMKE